MNLDARAGRINLTALVGRVFIGSRIGAVLIQARKGSGLEASITEVTFTYRGEQVTYGIVQSETGRYWMDRNLGASRVATAFNDSQAYGDLFQWGRLDDGHQDRASATTETLSDTDNPGHGDFILPDPDGVGDWRDPQNNNLWQSGLNVPASDADYGVWRLPTSSELDAERQEWETNNRAGAYGSALKLPSGGFRSVTGSLFNVGSGSYIYSSTPFSTAAYMLAFSQNDASISFVERAAGASVRLILDE